MTCFMETATGLSAVKGSLAGEHLVEDHAQGVEVAPGVYGFAQRLLGRHVARRAQNEARLGDRGVGGGARYPEVRDLHVARRGQEDVVGFYVAVDHPAPVRFFEGVG